MPLRIATLQVADADKALRRELHFFTLYRLLEAAMLLLVLYGPFSGFLPEPRHELFAQALAISYVFVAVLLFAFGRTGDLRLNALIGIGADLSFGILAIHTIPVAATGIALMLIFNVGAAALLLPTRLGIGMALVAVAGLIGEYVWTSGVEDPDGRALVEPLMFAVGYMAMATLTSVLGRQMRASQALAERRGAETAHLVEVNELIIRRLRTGVLVVNGDNEIVLANEAATALLGSRRDDEVVSLDILMPELARRLTVWRNGGIGAKADETPFQPGPDQPEVVPRFARLLAGSDQTLIFLDDTSLLSQRAESITLATLGRFSASLAHEIRNPLAAINYAVQLLEESDDIRPADRRLLEIIHQQGTRMNGIVDNVLGLARREPAKPEHVELAGLTRQFVDEYLAGHPIENDTLLATSSQARTTAMADPRQLHQVLTVLVHNALLYGRKPGEPARVTVHVHNDDKGAHRIDVIDRGPGVPERVALQLFRPFFTTSAHGTGLGLYIARELCRANQATLEYVPTPGVGSCFRIRFTPGMQEQPVPGRRTRSATAGA
ncbi:sensor histidine kinase [Marilutibacter alkalisoli]|uniref:sensor histidine kinase n=1 Tax=Marilutibacter alkalisoli TaxID=2591633 RepID=UPI001FC93D2E|nr:ATP-binding protein [Lysobacter alkalisoli]